MRPVVGIIADTAQKGLHIYHQVGEKYLEPLERIADVMPVTLPAFGDLSRAQIEERLATVDGLLIPGGYANIQRHLYGLPAAPDGELEDHARDAHSLPLIVAALKAEMPIFGICRGMQEVNVALGGSLYPRVHEVPGRIDHRENNQDPIEQQYGPAHSVTVTAGSILEAIIGEARFDVNSLHGQAIDRLASGLVVEAKADDGTIEAVRCYGAGGFNIFVQWHPEFDTVNNVQSVKLFKAFGEAVKNYNVQKTRA